MTAREARVATQVLICLGLVGATTFPLSAQAIPTWNLSDRLAKSDEEFDNITGVRELSDGRLIILDVGFYLANLTKGIGARIGRSGDGPGEYRLPRRLFAFRGDTTAYLDFARPGRLQFILPSGALRGSIELKAASDVREPEIADSLGRLYSERRRMKGPRAFRDTLDIVRWSAGGTRIDTVGRRNGVGVYGVKPLNNRPVPPFSTTEQWTVAPDGRVAVVAVNPYRVTFFGRDGSLTLGPALPVEKVRVTGAHRSAWRDEKREPIPSLLSMYGGPLTPTWRRRSAEEVEPPSWPQFLPPFLPGAASFGPDGMLWIQRTTPDPAFLSIDILDRGGKLIGRLVLPEGRKFIGHGKEGVYLVRIDDDGLQYIEHYRLPGGYTEAVSRSP